jgi:hypothetical protein
VTERPESRKGKEAPDPKMRYLGKTTNKNRRHRMDFTKKMFIFVVLSLTIGLLGCTSEKKAEAPKQEQISKNLVPAKTEVSGPAFLVELSDLKVLMTVDTASKEIVETPSLKGSMKITNKSNDNLDIQAVTFEYLDQAGKAIVFGPDDKAQNVYAFWKVLKPTEVAEGNLDITIPRKAVKEKTLGKIAVNLVFVPSPLKRETLTLSEKIE